MESVKHVILEALQNVRGQHVPLLNMCILSLIFSISIYFNSFFFIPPPPSTIIMDIVLADVSYSIYIQNIFHHCKTKKIFFFKQNPHSQRHRRMIIPKKGVGDEQGPPPPPQKKKKKKRIEKKT